MYPRPKIPFFRPIQPPSFRNLYVLEHKIGKKSKKDFAVKSVIPTFAVLSSEKSFKFFSPFKALVASALAIMRQNFLKNNCEKIW